VYPHLDWLIPWYVSDYISFDSDQKTMLEDRLSELLDWHCRTQLPAYATTLRELGQDIAHQTGPVNAAMLQAYHARLTALWKELLQQIGPDITAARRISPKSRRTHGQADEVLDIKTEYGTETGGIGLEFAAGTHCGRMAPESTSCSG
jgi:hypothetical protein